MIHPRKNKTGSAGDGVVLESGECGCWGCVVEGGVRVLGLRW